MRTVRWLVGLAAASAMAGAVASGCSGDDSSGTTADSGADQSVDHANEAAPAEAGQEDAEAQACVPDASLLALASVDASLGDSGATVSGCLMCAEAQCAAQITACSADCACTTGVQAFVACEQAGKDAVLECTPAFAQINQTAAQLAICVAGPLLGGTGTGCLTACGGVIPAGEGGLDGAKEGAAEASSEAGAEAAVDAAPEAAVDAAPEAAVDAAPEAAVDAAPEAAPEAGADAAPEATTEAGSPEASAEASSESGTDGATGD